MIIHPRISPLLDIEAAWIYRFWRNQCADFWPHLWSFFYINRSQEGAFQLCAVSRKKWIAWKTSGFCFSFSRGFGFGFYPRHRESITSLCRLRQAVFHPVGARRIPNKNHNFVGAVWNRGVETIPCCSQEFGGSHLHLWSVWDVCWTGWMRLRSWSGQRIEPGVSRITFAATLTQASCKLWSQNFLTSIPCEDGVSGSD